MTEAVYIERTASQFVWHRITHSQQCFSAQPVNRCCTKNEEDVHYSGVNSQGVLNQKDMKQGLPVY